MTEVEYGVDAWDRPLHWFVKDAGSGSAHLLDYRCASADHAICARPFGEIQWQGPKRPRAVCRACQDQLPAHDAAEWQRRANAQAEALAQTRARVDDLVSRLHEAQASIRRFDSEARAVESSADMPMHWYVRDADSRVAHLLDYGREGGDHGLCGHPFGDITWQGEERPRAVCRSCQAGLDGHEKRWWQGLARAEAGRRTKSEEALAQTLERQRELDLKVSNQRRALHALNTRLAKVSASNRSGAGAETRRSTRKSEAPALTGLPRLTKQQPSRGSESWLPKGYRVPRITVVSGGLPGHGKRR